MIFEGLEVGDRKIWMSELLELLKLKSLKQIIDGEVDNPQEEQHEQVS